MASTFDVTMYEEMVTEEASETKITPYPEGEYEAMCSGVSLQGYQGDDGRKSIRLDVQWKMLDPEASYLEESGNEEAVVRQNVWINLTTDGGISYKGDNVALGRLREALGFNKPGKPFNFQMLDGAGPAMVTVSQRTNPETEDVYSNVVRVKPVS